MRKVVAAFLLFSACGADAQQFAPSQAVPPTAYSIALQGVWNQTQSSPMSPLTQQTIQYMPDGSYTQYGVLGNGLRVIAWGTYIAQQQAGSNGQVTLQVQGWLPKQVCSQPEVCQQFRLPPTATGFVALLNANTMMANGATLTKGNVPAAATQPVPESERVSPQTMMQMQGGLPMQQGLPQAYRVPVPQVPMISPGMRYVSPGRPISRCDDLQQQRICSIRDNGRLVVSDGCLKCI